MRRPGPSRRKAATAARIVEPVASPSSTRITVRPCTSSGWAIAAIGPLAPLKFKTLPRGDGLDHAEWRIQRPR